MIEKKYEGVARYIETGIEAIGRFGLKALEFRDRHVKLVMPLAGNVNHVGMMYAGALFSLGEVVGGAIFGVAFDFRKYFPIVREVQIRYLQPALTDVTLTVDMTEAQVAEVLAVLEAKGKADFVLDLDLKDTNETVVAHVRGTWQARKIPEGFPVPWPTEGA
ncbi:MAG TPA: YiiD C-terminal domain-containing protein [Syntrophales bacterium]|nr:YiiD C-terminal domain-containing protein [Syntrophales bacterium]